MERASLCALVLLLAPGCASVAKAGEMCHAWTSGTESPVGPFQCPKRLDSANATFCCGNCGSRYCCSSREKRLDQKKCVPNRQPGKDPQSRARGLPSFVDCFPYTFATIAAMSFTVVVCWCLYQWQKMNNQAPYISPPARSCVTGTPPPSSVNPPSCRIRVRRGPFISTSALDSTVVVWLSSANRVLHKGESINLTQAAPMCTTGGGGSLEPVMEVEEMEQPVAGEDLEL